MMLRWLRCPFCFANTPQVAVTALNAGPAHNVTEYRCDACAKTWSEVGPRRDPSPLAPASSKLKTS